MPGKPSTIYSRYISSGVLGGTEYYSIFGNEANGIEGRRQVLWLEAGAFRNLRIVLSAAVTAATTIVYTLRINEAPTAMTITFSPGDLNKTYTASSISVSANDRISLESVNGGIGGGTPTWSLEFVPTNGSNSCYGSSFINGSGSTPLFFGLMNGFTGQGSAADVITTVIPCAGVISGLGVCLDSAPGGGNTAVFSIWKNGTQQNGAGGTQDTRITMSASRTGSSSFSLSVSAGDLIYSTYERTAGGGINIYGGVTMVFNPTIAGQFIIPGISGGGLVNGGVSYAPGATGNKGSGVIAGNSNISGITPISVGNLYVNLSTFPGAAKSYQFDFTTAESTSPVSGTPVVTISGGAATTGNDTSNSFPLPDNTLFTLRVSPSGTPTAVLAAWSLVGNFGNSGGGGGKGNSNKGKKSGGGGVNILNAGGTIEFNIGNAGLDIGSC